MSFRSPLSSRSRLLLIQLDRQCLLARKQLLDQRRDVSSAVKASPARQRAPASKPPVQTTPSPQDADANIARPLNRPLGLRDPPIPGENSGIDPRSWKQRRDDFVDYDKHLERRKVLTKQAAKPYYRDWSNMRFQKGKIFIAPTKLFRADKAFYFPNLRGITLASPKDEQDTTPVLQGRLSVVTVYSGTWAEEQVGTFVKENEKLDEALELGSPFMQRVDVNIELNSMKAGLIKLFMGSIRAKLPPEQHSRYFVVTRGVTDDLRECMGMLNQSVGYVFLVDHECRIRWAGSAEATDEEKQSLVRCIARLSREFEKQVEELDRTEEEFSCKEVFGITVQELDETVGKIGKLVQ